MFEIVCDSGPYASLDPIPFASPIRIHFPKIKMKKTFVFWVSIYKWKRIRILPCEENELNVNVTSLDCETHTNPTYFVIIP